MKKRWLVTLEKWRETFSGREQCDGSVVIEVFAKNEYYAYKKAERIALNPGKGKKWVQTVWVLRKGINGPF